MRRRGLPAPLWFHLALAALVGTIAHLCGFHELEASPVTFAFLGWLVVLAEVIWNGVQAATTAVVAFLSWAVNALFFLGQLAYNALIELGHLAMSGLRAAWRFFRWTYDEILKPAWLKFWKLVDTVHRTLDRILGPVLRALLRIRDEILCLYAKWVRPVLDTIETTRKIVHILSTLHVPFAAKLDHALGSLEQKIDRAFRALLAKVNETINLVNRVVTADGLFQRLALVRSLERDGQHLVRIWWNGQLARNAAPEPGLRGAGEVERISPEQITRDLSEYYDTGGGAYADRITELRAVWDQAAGSPADVGG